MFEQYTYQPIARDGEQNKDLAEKFIFISHDGHLFETERRAKNWCKMWNDHWSAMRRLDDVPSALTRGEYVATGASLNIETVSDKQCQDYSLVFGEFTPWLDENGEIAGYAPTYCLKMALARRRLTALRTQLDKAPY